MKPEYHNATAMCKQSFYNNHASHGVGGTEPISSIIFPIF